MQVPLRIITYAILGLAVFALPARAGTEFTAGEAPAFQCILDTVTHDFSPVQHRYWLSGRCASVQGGKVSYDAWANPITWEAMAKWNEETHEVVEQIRSGDGRIGGLKAICPADPVIYAGDCTGVEIEGNIYTEAGFSYHLEPVLVSRSVLPTDLKAALRQKLETPFPPPDIGNPLRDHFYGNAFRTPGGDYEIPMFLSIPYRADLLVTIGSWVPDDGGQSGGWRDQQQRIALAEMQVSEYGDTKIYAGRLSPALGVGKHRVVARALAGHDWKSAPSDTIEFFVVDEKAMEAAARDQPMAQLKRTPGFDRDAMRAVEQKALPADLTPEAFKSSVKSGAIRFRAEDQPTVADVNSLVTVHVASVPAGAKTQMRAAAIAPTLVVDRVEQKDMPLQAGQAVDLRVVFVNNGSKASDPTARYSVTCRVTAGEADCPVSNGEYPLGKAVDPGKSHAVKLAGSVAQAGEYVVTIAVPAPEKGEAFSGHRLSHTIHVQGIKKSVRKAAAIRQPE